MRGSSSSNYIIPSDNWEQQLEIIKEYGFTIISYQAITGNNNNQMAKCKYCGIISYQAITGNNNNRSMYTALKELYHTKR